MSGDLHRAEVDFRRNMFDLSEESTRNDVGLLDLQLWRFKLRGSLIRHLPLHPCQWCLWICDDGSSKRGNILWTQFVPSSATRRVIFCAHCTRFRPAWLYSAKHAAPRPLPPGQSCNLSAAQSPPSPEPRRYSVAPVRSAPGLVRCSGSRQAAALPEIPCHHSPPSTSATRSSPWRWSRVAAAAPRWDWRRLPSSAESYSRLVDGTTLIHHQVYTGGSSRRFWGRPTWRSEPSQGTPKTKNYSDLAHKFWGSGPKSRTKIKI